MKIPIYKPDIDNYKKSAIDAIESGWISNYGQYIEKAEKLLCDILGVKYCILMNNGTSATKCLFLALRYKYPDLEHIYLPNNTFVAPYNCALDVYNDKVNQEREGEFFSLMKLEINGVNIDTSDEYILSLRKNSAIVIVHNLGYVVNVPKIKRLRPDIIIVEDNCEGIFGRYETIDENKIERHIDKRIEGSKEDNKEDNKYSDKYTGTECLCSSVSFYANKTITTGEGGAFFTNDEEIYNHIRLVYSHGMSNERYIHCELAHNFRMTNVQAAFLYDQLLDLNSILEKKSNVFSVYDILLGDLFQNGIVSKPENSIGTRAAKWMYSLITPGINYNSIGKFLEEKGIDTRPFFYDANDHKHISICNKYGKSELFEYGIMLPSYPSISVEEQTYIVNCIREYILEKVKFPSANLDFYIGDKNKLQKFIQYRHSPFFTYYNKPSSDQQGMTYINRTISASDNHLFNVICTINGDNICGYGHIDIHGGEYWLGICVLEIFKGKGIGKILIRNLLSIADKNNIKIIKLSVHESNTTAINLYKKNNFVPFNQVNNVLYMKREYIMNLPVSLGEALDKLSILHIKKEKIDDERRKDVEYEYSILQDLLHSYMNNESITYYYYLLKNINLDIWEMQDIIRDIGNDMEMDAKNILAQEILEKNDERFKVKEKINNITNSRIKEQKGYKQKTCIILPHQNLGDIINIVPAVRYLSLIYSTVNIVIFDGYIEKYNNILKIEGDNSVNIIPYSTISDISSYNWSSDNKDLRIKLRETYNDVFLLGQYNSTVMDVADLPYCFYREIGIPKSVYWEYFYITKSNNSSKLYELVKDYDIIFIHSKTSKGDCFDTNNIINSLNITSKNYLIIDAEKNYYDDPRIKDSDEFDAVKRELVQKFINISAMDYVDVIKYSKYNILSDSFLFCLSLHIPIETDNNYYIGRIYLGKRLEYEYIWEDDIYKTMGLKRFECLNNII